MATLSNSGMIRWKMAKSVSKIVLNSGGYIFGGFIRDTILHDEAAKMFYNIYDDNSDKIYDIYNDKNVCPEYSDRLLQVNDIDCYMTINNFPNFEKMLLKNQYYIESKKENILSCYFAEEETKTTNLLITRVIVKFKTNEIIQNSIDKYNYHVKLDIIQGNSISEIYEEISFLIDFECNSLILTPENNYITAGREFSTLEPIEKLKKIQEIISSIKEKRAVLFNKKNYLGVSEFRVEKMLKKGYSLATDNILNVREDVDSMCFVCMEDISIKNFHTKHTLCGARFCVSCFIKTLNFDNYTKICSFCKKECNFEEREVELQRTIIRIDIDKKILQ